MIIENDEICIFIHKKVLLKADNDLEIDAFEKAHDALDFFYKNHASHELLPNVILLDINMPVMSGCDFLLEFNKLEPSLSKMPVIYVLSSTLWPPELERIHAHPMVTGFISKPFKIENAKHLLQQVQ